ncbi:MAG: GNAT family N-acetyltransferase [Chloroflexia bacterium]|nr:GNAT family N-acetyltransferase [Chloroflexia bacterium]
MNDVPIIYELGAPEFERAKPLFADARYDAAFLGAVFEGRQEGRMFVDDPCRPSAALLCRTYEYFVTGDATNAALRRFIVEAPAEARVFAELYGYVGLSAAWDAALRGDHGDRLDVIGRRCFRFPARGAERVAGWRERVPPGVRVQPIDRPLAERIDEVLREGIGTTWGGYERFTANGFGLCALIDDQPVSVGVTAAVGWGEANIGVITAAAHRRKGLAWLVCAAYIKECQRRGLVATWDCDVSNTASRALALNLGFGEERSFSELAPPGRASLALSRGRWVATASEGNAIAAWSASPR